MKHMGLHGIVNDINSLNDLFLSFVLCKLNTLLSIKGLTIDFTHPQIETCVAIAIIVEISIVFASETNLDIICAGTL